MMSIRRIGSNSLARQWCGRTTPYNGTWRWPPRDGKLDKTKRPAAGPDMTPRHVISAYGKSHYKD